MDSYLNDFCTQPMRDGESIRADFEEDDLHDMCEKCPNKRKCWEWEDKGYSAKEYYEWEIKATKCRESR